MEIVMNFLTYYSKAYFKWFIYLISACFCVELLNKVFSLKSKSLVVFEGYENSSCKFFCWFISIFLGGFWESKTLFHCFFANKLTLNWHFWVGGLFEGRKHLLTVLHRFIGNFEGLFLGFESSFWLCFCW